MPHSRDATGKQCKCFFHIPDINKACTASLACTKVDQPCSRHSARHIPFHICAVAKVWDVQSPPAGSPNVVPADLHAESFADIKQQICQVGAQRIRESSRDVGKPAQRCAPALKFLLHPACRTRSRCLKPRMVPAKELKPIPLTTTT